MELPRTSTAITTFAAVVTGAQITGSWNQRIDEESTGYMLTHEWWCRIH